MRALESGDYTVEEIDAITGPAIGRPKSATFRTMDIAGLDVVGHVLRNLAERLPDETARRALHAASLVEQLIENGWIGEKSGQGFYKREGSEILTLDPATMTYRPRQPARLPSLDAVKGVDSCCRARADAVHRRTTRSGALLRDTLGADARLCGGGRSRDRPLHRRRRSCDAVGVRMGARSLRALGRDRRAGCPGCRTARRRACPRQGSAVRRANTLPRRTRATSGSGPSTPANSERAHAGAQEKSRRQPGGSRRRRALRRVAFQDERDRRRHSPDSPGRAAEAAANFRALVVGTMRRTSRPAPT